MLIDSGADVSLLPRAPIAHLIDTKEGGDLYELEGFDGTRSHAPAVRLELYFLGRALRRHIILNAIPLLLDGPNLTWDEHQ